MPNSTAFRQLADVFPVSVVVAVAVPMPLWRYYLEQFHDYASVAASVFGVALALLKGWAVWRESKEARGAAAQGLASAAAGAAKAGTRAPGFLAAALAALGVVAVIGMLTSKRADAAPPSPASTQTAGRKRRSADDAGDDGDVDAGNTDGAPAWYVAAHADTGLHERHGNRSHPRVSAYFAHVDGFSASTDARKVPWCAAAVNAWLAAAGEAGTRSAMARSFMRWGVALDAPRRGCVVVLWRGTHDDGTTGHVGLFDRADMKYVYVLGGNQGDAVSVARFPLTRVLGYRWPRPLARTKTAIGAGAAAVGSTAAVGVQMAAELQPAVASTSTAVATMDAVKGPLQQAAGALSGTATAKYLLLGVSLLSLAGALLAIYGRRDVRMKTGA